MLFLNIQFPREQTIGILMNFHDFHHFDTLLAKKVCHFVIFVFLVEPDHVPPDRGLGHCNAACCVLQEFYTFYLMVAPFANPRGQSF